MNPLRCVVVAAVMVLAGCVTSVNPAVAVVHVSFEYGMGENPARHMWDALTKALDKCHAEGYSQAEASDAAKTSYEQSSQNACTRYLATVSYDCIGLGYQPN